MFLILAASLVALFLAIVFYLFYAPGKTKLVSPPPNTSSLRHGDDLSVLRAGSLMAG